MAKKSSKQSKTAAAAREKEVRSAYRAIGWTMLAGVWLMLAAALVSYHPADPPAPGYGIANETVRNWVGRFGALAASEIYLMLGPGAWVGMAGVAAFLLATAAGRKVTGLPLRMAGMLIMMITSSAFFAVLQGPEPGPQGPGGLVALYVVDQLDARFAVLGTLIIVCLFFLSGALLAADELVLALPRWLGRGMSRARVVRVPTPAVAKAASGLCFAKLPMPWSLRRNRDDDAPPREEPEPAAPGRRSRPGPAIDEDAGGLGATESFDPDDAPAEPEPEAEEAVAAAEPEEDDGGAPAAYAEEKQFTPDELRAKIKQLPINFAPRNDARKAAPPREPDLSGYQFPGLDLLEEPETGFTEEMEAIVRDQAMALEAALREYRIEGEVVGIDSGPVITLFEVRLAPGTKVAQLNSVDADLARALKAQNIRIVPNMVGRDTVGIEVPNIKKEKVRLRELMANLPEITQKMGLPMFLGKDASGNPLIQDLTKMPHMLIAGTTGSGKSVCMNSIIMSFLYTRRPDELKLVLVDPKMVEMSQFKDVPHLMCPVVTEMSKAASILEWAVTKMDERYELLAEAGVRDIAGYNSLGREELIERMEPATEEEEARIPKKLPFMVFVIDELADLMMTNKEVESFVVRIAQKARAVGIHLILATQRPSANVVTGLIKSNMPCRIAFKVASGMDSRIVLDQKGGEVLLGQGDMLYLSPRTSKLIRAQGTLVDDSEIRKAVKFLKNVAQQHFEPQLVQIRSGPADVDEEAAKDDLFEDAVRVVLESKRGSVSLLQRRLTIGYSRASRLIEAMASAGILGEHKGSQAREVTITLDEWEALREQAEQDAAGEVDPELYVPSDKAEDDSVPEEFDDEFRQ
ncbi:MAG: DNA translocase FtsK 4TM domain-containing protein [Phycisphaeraceae bacterium]